MAWKFLPILFVTLAPAWARAAAPPEDAAVLYKQALAAEQAGNLVQAIAGFKSALRADSTLSQAYLELGRCYEQLGWRRQALEYLHDYLDSGAQDPRASAEYESLTAQAERIGIFRDGGDADLLASDRGFNLQADLGYGWGFNQYNFGRRYNRDSNSNPFTYTYNAGEGIFLNLEGLYSFSPNFALGLSLDPILGGSSGSESITYAGLTYTADSSSMRESSYPILVNLHAQARLGPNVKLGCFIGAGLSVNQPYIETATDVSQAPLGTSYTATSTSTLRYQRNMGLGPAAAGGFSLEFLLRPQLTLYLKGSLLLAQAYPTSASYSESVVDNATGKVVATYTDNDTYVASPPKTQLVDAGAGVTGPAGTTTYTYDNGPTQYVDTVVAGATPSETFTESNVLPNNQDGITFKVVAASAGLRWEF